MPALAQPVDPEVAAEASGLASGMGGSSPALRALTQRSSQPGVSRDFVLGVLKGARQMQQQGLPTEAYLLKANEGLAKQVSENKLSTALRDSRGDTESAARWVDGAVARENRVLAPQERQRAIVGYQNARLNGISAEQLEQVARQPGSLEKIDQTLQELTPRRHEVSQAKFPAQAVSPAAVSVPTAKPQAPTWKAERAKVAPTKKNPGGENPLSLGKKEWKKHGQGEDHGLMENAGGGHGLEGQHGNSHGGGKGFGRGKK